MQVQKKKKKSLSNPNYEFHIFQNVKIYFDAFTVELKELASTKNTLIICSMSD